MRNISFKCWCQFHWTCGTNLAKSSIYRGLRSPKWHTDVQRHNTATLGRYFSKELLLIFWFFLGGSPSAWSSASWKAPKTPFSSLKDRRHYDPRLRHTYKAQHEIIHTRVGKFTWTFSHNASKAVLPFKAITLLSSAVAVRLEPERPLGLAALSCCGIGAAERSRSLQLGSHHFGIATVVARPRAVRRLITKKPGDGGMAATGGRRRGDKRLK